MKKTYLIVSIMLSSAPASLVQAMWYVVDPEEKVVVSNEHKGYLLQKIMVGIALSDSDLDGAKEKKKLQSYCQQHAKSKGGIPCPDPDCDSTLASAKSLKTHWYSVTGHQPQLYAQVTDLIVQNKQDAERRYNKRARVEVIPFPEDQAIPHADRVVKKASVQVVVDQPVDQAPVQAPVKPVTYYLLEELTGIPGAFSTFMELSREQLLMAYLQSKKLEGNPLDLEALKVELLTRTKKQQMVQGNVVQSLVCPAAGCKYQCTEPSKQDEREKIAQVLVVHYAAYHKQDHPSIKRIVDLIAPSFVEARKNLEKGK